MDAMSTRLRGLGFGTKRKSSANIQTAVVQTNGTASPTPPPNSSQTSLPPSMNNQQTGLGRPPSYSYPPGQRPTSPMPPGQQHLAHHPPPIDTTNQRYPGPNPAMQGAPQPPGYGGYGHAPQQGAMSHGMNQYGRPGPPAEVEGAGRSKAQLIVGIDFVCKPEKIGKSDDGNANTIRVQPSQASRSPLRQIQRPKRISSQSGRVRVTKPNKRYNR